MEKSGSLLSGLVSAYPPPPAYYIQTEDWSLVQPPTIPNDDSVTIFGIPMAQGMGLENVSEVFQQEGFLRDLVQKWTDTIYDLLEYLSKTYDIELLLSQGQSMHENDSKLESYISTIGGLIEAFKEACQYYRRVQAKQGMIKMFEQKIKHQERMIDSLRSLIQRYIDLFQ
jgi:hypothetical protein